jgi:DNA-binding NarL/FixJ family response regulator
MWRTRSKFKKEDINDDQHMEDEFFLQQITETMMGPKTAFMLQETVKEVLGVLSEKNQKLVLMKAAGFSTVEIAEELGYATPQAVSNQLRRIQVQAEAHRESTYRNNL